MTHPKKILYVITKANFGGAQRYVLELACAFKDEGHQVAVAVGGSGELINRLQAAGIEVFSIAGAQRDINLKQEITALASLFHIIREYRPDIVHLNSSKVGVLGSLIARSLRVPHIVFTAHGWPFLEARPWQWRAMAWIGSYLTALLAHAVITVSEHDKAAQHMPLIARKTTVIHPSLSPFTPLDRTSARAALYPPHIREAHASHVWVGTIGELTQNKNHTTLIDVIAAFNATHHTKLFLTIIGAGELRESLTEQIELRGATTFANLYGPLAEARLYLSAFDIFILPSRKEGLPYALLEAGYAGLPCIASHVGGIGEIISDGERGLLIDPQSPRELEEALEMLINQPDLRVSFATALEAHVREQFAPPRAFQLIRTVYRLPT